MLRFGAQRPPDCPQYEPITDDVDGTSDPGAGNGRRETLVSSDRPREPRPAPQRRRSGPHLVSEMTTQRDRDAAETAETLEIDGSPSILETRHPLAVVYGGGGVFGIGYGAGVATGLIRSGLPLAGAPSLGTSAGAWVASMLALGIDYDELDRIDAPSVPTRQPVLVEAAESVFGDARHHLVSITAVRLRSGRRRLLDGGEHRLADLVAASSAVPGLFPPHRVDGELYVDGGMWSATSVDAGASADDVIVIAPLAGPVLGPVGRTAGVLLAREIRGWQRRHPDTRITMIRPDSAIGRLAGRNPLGLFDGDRGRAVYPLAVEQGLRWGERLQAERTS